MSTAIATISGVYVNPLNLIPSDIDITVIAHSLSHLCRFNGHTKRFYSVAQHSVHVAERVAQLTSNRTIQLAALFHDASEAYLGDIVAPLKKSMLFKLYCDVEQNVENTIDTALGIASLSENERWLIQRVDLDLCALEAEQLGGWNLDAPEWKGLRSTFHRKLLPLRPTQARKLFLSFLAEIQYGV